MSPRQIRPGRLLQACPAWLLVLLAALAPCLAQAGEPNRAGLVVQYGDGRLETRCVQFEAESISGADLLAKSGLAVAIDASSGLGIIVCQIEGQGCAYPAERCFCQCSGTGACAYWNYFYRDPDQPDWAYAAQGALRHQARPGSVEAWVWGNGQTSPAADLTFEAVCQPEMDSRLRGNDGGGGGVGRQVPAPTPSPTASAPPAPGAPDRPVAQPQVATSAPTAGPSPQPTRLAQGAYQPPATPSAPPATGPYWLFGGMGLVLLLVGAAAWLRGRK